MAKLIAFYSRADENYFGGQYRYVKVGNTEKVAKMISDLTGADMFKIEQKVPYSANYKECVAQSVKDLKSKARPELVSLPNLDDYDEIYLGYPNYCGTMPMAAVLKTGCALPLTRSGRSATGWVMISSSVSAIPATRTCPAG